MKKPKKIKMSYKKIKNKNVVKIIDDYINKIDAIFKLYKINEK